MCGRTDTIGAVRPTLSSSVTCGDAYDLLPELPSRSVDLLITSPPYWGLRTYGLEHDDRALERFRSLGRGSLESPGYEWYREAGGVLGLEPYPEWYVSHLVEILDRARPALHPHANLWVNLGDTYFARWSSIRQDGRQGLAGDQRLRRRTPSGGIRHDKQLLLIPARFAIAMQEVGWILRNDVIWAKSSVAPRPERDRLRLAHEHFFHFVQRAPGRRPRYFYDLSAVEPGARDVVSAPVSQGGDGHSATFHRSLIEPRVLSSCPPGGVVVDPFCGSGTTLQCAVEHGRVAIGFDVSPRYARLAATRVTGATDEAAESLAS